MKKRNFSTKKAPNIRSLKKRNKEFKSVHISKENHKFIERIYLNRKLEGKEASIRSVLEEIIHDYMDRKK